MVYNLSEKFFLMLVYSLILFGYKQKMVFIILSCFQFIKSLALEPTPHCLRDYHMCALWSVSPMRVTQGRWAKSATHVFHLYTDFLSASSTEDCKNNARVFNHL